MTTVNAQVQMSASSDLESPHIPTLEEQIKALEGQDPLLVGSTGYMDDVFTNRLWGDSE